VLGYHRQARILGATRRHVNEILGVFAPGAPPLPVPVTSPLTATSARRIHFMKILVVGAGAREHAIAWKLSRERSVTEVLCTPGNPGIAACARCVEADPGKPQDILAVARREGADLTVVGPELPLSVGVVDLFAAKRMPIVGPTRAAAALESSKVFAKEFMARHGVPTARFRNCDSPEAALALIDAGSFGFPVVLKADGLAAGKGVVIAANRNEAADAVRAVMVDRRFGGAGARLVIEEYLEGTEASYFVIADGTRFVPMASAQDHKRIFDGDRGPNTGGMGAFAPSPLVTPALESRVLDEVVRPVLAGMSAEGHPFCGFLYVGLMLTKDGPKVIEFNVRFGDPEAQVLFPMLDEDLSWLLGAAATGALPQRPIRFRSEPHVAVVLAAPGYPDAVETGQVISGLDEASRVPGALVFHAGTARRDRQIVTAGGRVLSVVGSGGTFKHAIDVAYRAASLIHFDGMQMRRDIGRTAMAPQ
jgi:phosphoribosylamine---glycine ligase